MQVTGIIGTIGALLITAALFVFLINDELLQYVYALMGMGTLGVAYYLVYARVSVKKALGSRSTRYGANAILYSVIILAILAVANFIATRKTVRWDVTQEGFFTLEGQTEALLKGLTDEVEAIAFYSGSSPDDAETYTSLKKLLENYASLSDKFKYRFIAPEQSPLEVSQYKIKAGGARIILKRKVGEDVREERVKDPTEQGLTNGLVKLTRNTVKKIYFVSGHGEGDTSAKDSPDGYGRAIDALEADGYQHAALNLISDGKVPDDAAAVVIAGLRKPLLDPESAMLQIYLANNGRLLLMLEPLAEHGTEALLASYGIIAANNIILDTSAMQLFKGGGASIAMAASYDPDHPIVKNFQFATFFPTARSLGIAGDKPEGVSAYEIVRTSPGAWGETSLGSPEAQFDEGTDTRGPLAVAITAAKIGKAPEGAAEDAPIPEARIAVFGDSDFASNQGISLSGNSDLFLNTIAWLAQEDDMISIRPKKLNSSRLFLTESQGNFVYYFAQAIMPFGILLAGAMVWYSRRRK